MPVMFQWRFLLSFWSWKTSLYAFAKIAYASADYYWLNIRQCCFLRFWRGNDTWDREEKPISTSFILLKQRLWSWYGKGYEHRKSVLGERLWENLAWHGKKRSHCYPGSDDTNFYILFTLQYWIMVLIWYHNMIHQESHIWKERVMSKGI